MILATVAILTSILGLSYTFWINPEIQFWKGAAQKKLAWCAKMRAKHGYVIGVVGGSSTTFGIDAAWIEKITAFQLLTSVLEQELALMHALALAWRHSSKGIHSS